MRCPVNLFGLKSMGYRALRDQSGDQTAEYGRFRQDLGCGKAVKSRGRGAKTI